jgi:hypothetical protein
MILNIDRNMIIAGTTKGIVNIYNIIDGEITSNL